MSRILDDGQIFTNPIGVAKPAQPEPVKRRIELQQLRQVAKSAIADGLVFLGQAVETNGAWPCERLGSGPAEDRTPPFLAAAGALALEACGEGQAENILSRTCDFVVSRIEPPGLWRWAPYELDLDSTSVCSLASGPHRHPWLFLGRNVSRILSNRDRKGRFLTWLGTHGPLGEPNDADPVVNANIVAFLGDREETRAAQRWIEALVVEKRESGSSKWYGSPMDVYYCVSRASHVAAPAFEGLRQKLADRILDAKPDNALTIAQALSSLDRLGEPFHVNFVQQYTERLIDMQEAGGGWPAGEVCQAMSGVCTYWSETLTTAYCIEALVRFSQS